MIPKAWQFLNLDRIRIVTEEEEELAQRLSWQPYGGSEQGLAGGSGRMRREAFAIYKCGGERNDDDPKRGISTFTNQVDFLFIVILPWR